MRLPPRQPICCRPLNGMQPPDENRGASLLLQPDSIGAASDFPRDQTLLAPWGELTRLAQRNAPGPQRPEDDDPVALEAHPAFRIRNDARIESQMIQPKTRSPMPTPRRTSRTDSAALKTSPMIA